MKVPILHYSLLSIFCMFSYMPVVMAVSEHLEFDTSILEQRGLDIKLSDYFADAPKFTPGMHNVAVRVNGRDAGRIAAHFNEKGDLCASESFLQDAGLIVPMALYLKGENDGSGKNQTSLCYDYHDAYPAASIISRPGQERLDITVPQEAVDTVALGNIVRNYHTGGTATLMNYSLYSSKNTSHNNKSTYQQGMLEDGFNIRDWTVRSRQSITIHDGKRRNDYLYTYAQHTIVGLRKLLQIGEINNSDSLFSGLPMTGAQLMPESALTNTADNGFIVDGIAHAAQARVDIRQNSQLVYSVLVPAGPFSLSNIPVVSQNADLDVTITETDGGINHFVIPAAMAMKNSLGQPDELSVSLGRYRSSDSKEEPMLATTSKGWRVLPMLNVNTGILVSRKYDALGWAMDMTPVDNLRISLSQRISDDTGHHTRGISYTLSSSYQVSDSFSLNASTSRDTANYRDFSESFAENDNSQNHYALGARLNQHSLGSFSLNYSMSENGSKQGVNRFLSISWGKTFYNVNVNASWQTQLNHGDASNDQYGLNHNSFNDDMFYVNVSVPLGKQYLSSYMRTRGNSTSSGLQTSGNLSQDTSYTLSMDHANHGNENSFDTSVNSNLHYTQLGASYSTSNSGQRSQSMTLNGGLVANSNGITFSPLPVSDTFALIDAGKNARGLEVSTPAGTVWTDHWGHAVIPSVPAYRKARVEINTDKLPENVDIDNGFAQLSSGRGAVSHVTFHVAKVKRALIHVAMKNGQELRKGMSVMDGKNHYVTTIVADGILYLPDISEHRALFAVDDAGERVCQINYIPPEETNQLAYYSRIEGICK